MDTFDKDCFDMNMTGHRLGRAETWLIIKHGGKKTHWDIRRLSVDPRQTEGGRHRKIM